jgi:hypothetical protein
MIVLVEENIRHTKNFRGIEAILFLKPELEFFNNLWGLGTE